MKILCLGNNTKDTDDQTAVLALANNMKSFGLISDLETTYDLSQPLSEGYYHSSIYDFPRRLPELILLFDKVILLDQPIEQWTHPNAYTDTIRILNNTLVNVEYMGNVGIFDYWHSLLQENKSFCIYPFVGIVLDQYNSGSVVCCRSADVVEPLYQEKINFNSDNYNILRNNILSNKKIPNCQACYDLEKRNIVSARQYETLEWVNKLTIQSLYDIKQHTIPMYYEIRADNKCNLMCRTCNPTGSNLIETEYIDLGLISSTINKTVNLDYIDIYNIDKLYIAGGEPFVSDNIYNFLYKCYENNCINFELIINTNMVAIPNRFKKILSKFKNLHFIASIDGYNRLNHYIRYPSKWCKIEQNLQYALSIGKLSFNITISIYNIGNLYPLYGFLEKNFKTAEVHCQLAGGGLDTYNVYNHPDAEYVIQDLNLCNALSICKNNQIVLSLHDSLINHFTYRNNIPTLVNFFDFNDKLDKNRNIYLKDYNKMLNDHRNIHKINKSN